MARSVLKDKNGNDITWLMATIRALEILGKPASVNEIFDIMASNVVEEIPKSAKTPTQTIYGQIYTHSKDSAAGKGENIFYSTRVKGIWGLVDNNKLPELDVGMSGDDTEFPEGRAILQKHLYHERNKKLVETAKRIFSEKHNGRFYCEICGFDFFDVYGEVGEDFIEAHHIKPVAEMENGEKTRVEDLVMLCPNCHRMVHRIRPWIDNKADLRNILKKL